MTKEQILSEIATATNGSKSRKERNSMGVSENYYNPYFLIGKCFAPESLAEMSEWELQTLLKLAEFAADVFY